MSNAVERIQAYLEELSTRNNLDQDVIQNLRPEALGEISLRVADLKAVLNALEATLQFLVKLDGLDADMGTEPGNDNISASGVAIIMRRSIAEALS